VDVVHADVARAAHRPSRAQRWWSGRFGRQLGLEALLVVVVYQGYKWARRLTNDHYGTAFQNARRVADWEAAVGLLVEDDLQRLVLHSSELIWFLNHYYATVHFSATITLLVWLYVRHGDLYGRVRRVLLGTTAVALVVHVLFPLAPPRMLPSMGFVDTISRYGPQIYQNPSVAGTVNQIAAMPSLHFGWSAIAAWAVVRALRHPLRWVAVLHPTVTLAAIVFTANHWWLDAAVAGAIALGVAWADQHLLPMYGARADRDALGVPARGAPAPLEDAPDQRELEHAH